MEPRDLLALLESRGETLAFAESLTGGLLTDAFVTIPGASAVVRGGITAYATDLKASLLGVDPALLKERGAVDPDVAVAMAKGIRKRLGATYGLATTGVAGPEPQDGKAVGTVYIAVSGPGGDRVERLMIAGTRAQIRRCAVTAASGLLTGTA